ncbi:MAG: hypothetical protein KF878_28335 [Planctomycetes bacterium]|nr:hypothetical protein [Planctomycetota bacterium]
MALDSDPVLVTLATGRQVDVLPNGCTSVVLPRSLPPTVGTTCVVCGLEPQRRPRASEVPRWTWASSILLPTRFVPEPPACRRCALVCTVRRVLGLVAVLIAMLLAGASARLWGWSWLGGLALSAALPVVTGLLLRWAAPPWFEVGYDRVPESLSYTFRRHAAAVDFARRNAVPADDEVM